MPKAFSSPRKSLQQDKRSPFLAKFLSFFKPLNNFRSFFSPYWLACILLAAIIVAFSSTVATAQDSQALTLEQIQGTINTIWVLIAAILVIFMNAGFAMLEVGFCRHKNAVNILSKNLIVFALASLAFWSVGFAVMFSGTDNPLWGLEGFFLSGEPQTYGLEPFPAGLPISVFFLFQAAFAGTAATIISGAVAERIRFFDFLVFSVLLTAIAYPITGHWVWSANGWLANLGFHDFAGSTVVHSVGGWSALVGAILLGAREGKYQNGRIGAFPGHNMSIATLGCLILWIGWFGFNPGSELAANEAVPFIAVNTNLAAAAGGVAATITSWSKYGKPDLSMMINGILAGLVSITAGCDVVDYSSAVIIGFIAGVLVVLAVAFFDLIEIDDPVGATSVHLVCGIWGTLAVGIFANPNNPNQNGVQDAIAGLLYGDSAQLIIQLKGIAVVGTFTIVFSLIAWGLIKAIFGLRVSREEEIHGLDMGEHGMEAYSGFVKESDILMGHPSSNNETSDNIYENTYENT